MNWLEAEFDDELKDQSLTSVILEGRGAYAKEVMFAERGSCIVFLDGSMLCYLWCDPFRSLCWMCGCAVVRKDF